MHQVSARSLSKSPQYTAMRRILAELQAHPLAWAFLQPVNGDEVADYYSVIKQPMGTSVRFGALFTPHHKFFFTLRTDFSTMEHKLETSQYQSMDAFVADAKLVFRNCRNYNQEGSIYVRNANKLEKALTDMLEKIEVD